MKLVKLSPYRMRMPWKKFEKVSTTLSRMMLTNQDISTCDITHTESPISGAHFNPAVTVAFATCGRFPWKQVSPSEATLRSGILSIGDLKF